MFGRGRYQGTRPKATTPRPDVEIVGQGGTKWAMPRELSEASLADASLSYRHDFGLLSNEEQERIIFEAREWYRALYKSVCEPVAGMVVEATT